MTTAPGLTQPAPTPRTVDYNRCYTDLDPAFAPLYERCRPFTMTSIERMYALYEAVRYLVRAGVRGDIVECGVWRGGSIMLAALTLMQQGDSARRLYLYDTFEGMTQPGDDDRDLFDRPARRALADGGMQEFSQWCRSGLDEVRRNMESTGIDPSRVVYVRGPVEQTIPGTMPEAAALVRLDTDWFQSTYHELTHLYPRLAAGGVLIIDDYGHWRGAREATDRYLREHHEPILLQRIDYTGRLGIRVKA
jgi:O-methyltransferase